ncbi:DUF1385 domain-containing protein [uncultured Selenomonas sp.]|uniref:DUF1385 domain-containing protein n=1 Tax=uncultured Selenomonas sp. TaxID=159275 RepID=UPI002804E2E0|nr:DUF1385 domain-containing protein [uncultured Selenomonas sp.]
MAKLSVGGQAVIEGVMMRGPKDVATAVRDPNGRIQVETHPVSSIADRYPILKKPMLRGTVSLVESLVLGLRSLSYSAKMAGDEDEQLTDKEMAGTIIFALVLASILFIAIPTGAAKFFHFITDDPVFLNLMEGFLRLAIFLAYIGGISRMKDIRRVFQYHGAEHKTIHCYEAGLPLTVANVQRFSRLHPRCGTNFLLIVMLVSIFVYAFLGWPSLIERIVSRILLLPVVAGISYELIRFAGRTTNPVALKLIKPGLWLQYLTTRPPQDDMVEVAIESLKAVLPAEEILPGSGSYLEEAAKADTAAEPPSADHVPALES